MVVPSGKPTVCELENPYFSWVNPRTKWAFSIAMLKYGGKLGIIIFITPHIKINIIIIMTQYGIHFRFEAQQSTKGSW